MSGNCQFTGNRHHAGCHLSKRNADYKPLTVRCTKCCREVVPIQRIRPSCKTHVLATVLFCLFFPCAMLPYYIDELQSTELYCPYCSSYITTLCV